MQVNDPEGRLRGAPPRGINGGVTKAQKYIWYFEHFVTQQRPSRATFFTKPFIMFNH
jgi:hypothetical protein